MSFCGDGGAEARKRLPIGKAVRQVAAAIAARDGDDFLGPLTKRQRRIIAYYGAMPEKRYGPCSIVSSIVPGTIKISQGGVNWTRYPSDPELRTEVQRALCQRDLYEEQCKEAFDWLAGHDFDIDAESVDSEVFAQVMAKAFPFTDPCPSMSDQAEARSVVVLDGEELDTAIRDAATEAIKRNAEGGGKKLNSNGQRPSAGTWESRRSRRAASSQ
jgi:hypothetical protein